MFRLATIAVAAALLLGGAWLFSLRPHRAELGPAPLVPPATSRLRLPTVQANATFNQVGGLSQPRKRPWDTNFLANLQGASQGEPIRFDLPGGQVASGRLSTLVRSANKVGYVAGRLAEPEAGRFFFQRQTVPGVAGDFVGVVEFPGSKLAYRLEPTGPGASAELVERPLGSVLCMELPQPVTPPGAPAEQIPPLNPEQFPTLPIPDYQQGIVVLQSLPETVPVIYLDFQGGYTPTWGGITYARPNYDNGQIREIWERVAEDYLPFNINVATDLRIYQDAPEGSRQHVIITPTDTAYPGAGGVSYIGSFDWTGDTPCWVFVTNGARFCAQACAHEAGHSFGLVHDGQQINGTHLEYYYGQDANNPDTSWAPIMGVAYYDNVTQWSKGEYIDANNPQDQLAIISSQNNVHFRSDDTGDTLATSRYLELFDDYSASAEGVIETTGDTDAFQFTTAGGGVSLRADPVSVGPDLAIQVTLCDASDTVIASNNPQDTLWASITTNLPAGTYTFRVTGAGRNDPVTNGFSAYASLGYYSITGSVANARLPTRFTLPEHSPNGTLVGIVPPQSPTQDPLTYTIVSGNSGGAFAIDNSGDLSVANNALLDYATLGRNSQLAVQLDLFVDIFDTANPLLNETNRRVVVAITPIKQAPGIAGFVVSNVLTSSSGTMPPQFTASVQQHAPPGTEVGALLGTDNDEFVLLSYAILSGNDDGMFAIGSESGVITVAGDPVAATRNLYNLVISVSDESLPTPLVSTSLVTIMVELPYPLGNLPCSIYTNIPGTLVSDLTNSPGFPNNPASELVLTSFATSSPQERAMGEVIRGYLLPPATGLYTFWIASRDNSELWLGSTTNPASSVKIAELSGTGNWANPGDWAKYPGQQSQPIPLQVGYAYYIEARLKADTTSNFLAVAWECVSNGIPRQIIPGQYLSPYSVKYQPHPVGFTAYLHRDAIAGTQIGRVMVTDFNGVGAETLTITAGNDQGWFFLDSLTGLISLVDETALSSVGSNTYQLAIQATDNSSPPLSGTATVTIKVVPPDAVVAGVLQEEIWSNVRGTAVTDLTDQPQFPKRPDLLRPLTGFASGSGVNSTGLANSASSDNPVPTLSDYGSRIRAYLVPTNSGFYSFFLASSGDSLLLLSATTNSAAAAKVASVSGTWTGYQEWTQYSSQQSDAVWLTAGNQYYLEALHKVGEDFVSGSGINAATARLAPHLEVGWAGPGLPGTNLIDASFLQPVDLEYAPELPDQTVQMTLAVATGTTVARFAALDSPLDRLAYKIVSGNFSNTFALDPVSGALTVANNLAIISGAVSNFALIVEAQDSGYGGLYPPKSTQPTISFRVADNSQGTVSWSGTGTDNQWSNPQNWYGAVPNNASTLSFAGASQLTNYNDLLASAELVSLNGSGFFIWGNPLVLSRGIASGGKNTWAINTRLAQPATWSAIYGSFVVTGSIDNDTNLLTLQVNSTLRLDGPVSGSGGLTKFGNGVLWMSASNTYTGPTSIQFGTLALTNSGSLASSNLSVMYSGRLDVSGTASSYIVPAGQTLTGNGTVLGPITINGALRPTAINPGMIFSNRLVLAGSTFLSLNQTLKVYGELQYGGILTLLTNNLGGPNINHTYKLFQANEFSGAFTEFNLPPGFRWDTSGLITNGTIRALAIVPLSVPILPLTTANGIFIIRFPSTLGSHYILESTTTLVEPVHWSLSVYRDGNGGIISIPFARPDAVPQRFFRVKTY